MRLGLQSLAYLWMIEQGQLLKDMIRDRMDARIVKICSMGLNDSMLGKNIAQL